MRKLRKLQHVRGTSLQALHALERSAWHLWQRRITIYHISQELGFLLESMLGILPMRKAQER